MIRKTCKKLLRMIEAHNLTRSKNFFNYWKLLTCDIDNPKSDTIKTTEYDLDHNLLIKDINNLMSK